MNELIQINTTVIGTENVNSINARDLHEFLEIKKDFSNWINNQIKSLGLEENVDYVVFSHKVKAGHGTTNRKEYIITTDTAKHISMASRTAKGKEARNYFIEVEKRYIENINLDSLHGRIGGLTASNNKLKDEVKKLKKKLNNRVDALEDDVNDLKYQQKLLPNKTLDEKLQIIFKKSDILNSVNTDCFLQEALQNFNKFYIEYIKVLKSDGNELQKWAIEQIEKANNEKKEESKKRILANHKYEILLEKIKKMQDATRAIVNLDIENEMRFFEIS